MSSTFTPEPTVSHALPARGDLEPENTTSASKRRRVPESVTRNACVNCKRARAKCDGKQPCKRCMSRLEAPECNYEVHVKHAKEELVKQIKDLRAKDLLTDQILQALSSGEDGLEIIERLKIGDTYESIVDWLGGKSTIGDVEPHSPSHSQYSIFEPPINEMNGSSPTTQPWTSVTSNPAVLDHLFQLYFAWVHPVHTLFSEGLFVDSYRRQSSAYCSTLLVNSICAMACHLHSAADSEIDFEQLGTEFSDAVRATVDSGDTKITTIQALAVMFLVDSARADGLRAASYLKLAMNGLPLITCIDGAGFHESWQNTVRGVRNLNVEWSQMTFQVPATIDFTTSESYNVISVEHDDASWYCYRHINDQCTAWPGLMATTNREKSKLIAIISDVATMMYSQQGPSLTANRILQQYDRFSTWRGQLPAIIGNVKDNNQLPHVLSLLILYSNSVVQLLRPLLELDGFPTALVEEVIWSHAQQGLALLDEYYRAQYTCRRQQVLQMFGVLHLVDVIARFFPNGIDGSGKDGLEALQLGLEVLMESHEGFPVAGPLREMLRRSAKNFSIYLPADSRELLIPSLKHNFYRMDDMIDACTRPTYIQPVSMINNKLTPSFSSEWASGATSFGFPNLNAVSSRIRNLSDESGGGQNFMQIRNLLNT